MGTLNWFYWELSACGGYHKKYPLLILMIPFLLAQTGELYSSQILPYLDCLLFLKICCTWGQCYQKCFFQSLLYFYFDNMRALVVLILDGDWRQLVDHFDHNLVEHVLTGTKMVKMCSYYLFAVISVLFSYWVFADHISYGFLFKIDIGSGSSKLIVALC